MGYYDMQQMGLGPQNTRSTPQNTGDTPQNSIDTNTITPPRSNVYSDQLTPDGDTSFNGSARDTNSRLIAAQWNDYVSRYKPIEGELQGGLTFDPKTGEQRIGVINQNIDTATKAVDNAYDAGQGQMLRQFSRQGIAPDDRTMSSIQRATAISKAAAQVSAENMTRERLADRNQEIALGSVVSSGRNY